MLENDFLGNGYKGPRQITSVTVPENGGTVEIRDNSLFYSPAEMYTGSDSFSYTIDNELEATVTLHVNALAQHDSEYQCVNDFSNPMTFRVLSNDYFDQGYAEIAPAVITSVDNVNAGNVTINPGGKSVLVNLSSQPYQSFEYTVDEKYTATASISIRGHLRSDSTVVDQNSDAQPFQVLENDFQFHPNPRFEQCVANYYRGEQEITAVTESEMGGVVTIADNGKSVNYEPPEDYLGQDSFEYEVDGIMRQTAFVNVIRRVRDDQFRVDPGTQNEPLPVLVNDLFGADYGGAGVVTEVTASAADATLSISPDGRSILYSAPEGFRGDDTFVYTVDGRQLAEVTVQFEIQTKSHLTNLKHLQSSNNS